ncbi:hypothetical protein [Virgibacillus alimentarius]|uniref:Uncharacterized protein n=1 Tax=Virgibacillus alimentarius TaxID=698769 RepID=A0ABS4SBV6_9BACI|nr:MULTISPECIES: hypothetical protein [Virgibacillus]MBP2258842.1 hypothetical protein [Virgibacillus alimentarius]HLR65759.1 hypothetical protein [Virgibacillus sp.]
MMTFFPIYAVFVLLIFNFLVDKLCHALEMEKSKQAGTFRMVNVMVLILLFSSYLRILNAMV